MPCNDININNINNYEKLKFGQKHPAHALLAESTFILPYA